jgi:SNF family Na+-dependent transporter
MNFLRTSNFKRTSASVLLVLFTFIHAVKAFHTHDFSYLAKEQNSNKNAATVNAAFSCAICNFQIAKHSDAEVAVINISAPLHYITTFYNYALPLLTSFAITSSVRGPPSFLS